MKYCAHCGAELHDEAVICTRCGCAVDGAVNKTYTENAKWNGFSIAGFIVSFFSVLIGLILSIVGYVQTKRTGEKGKGLALAGIIISSVLIAITIIFWIIMIWLSVVIQHNGGM